MRIKLSLIAMVCALSLAATAAVAQGTPKPKASLNAEISSQFPDNSAGGITPQILRNVTNDMVASSQQYAGVNAQVGTSYTIVLSDYGQLVTFSNTGAVAVTLPGAGTSGFTPFNVYIANLNTGLVTVTPSIGTINGAASLTVSQGVSIWIVSDNTNYQVFKGFGSGAINSGTAGQMAYYATTGSAVSGNSNANISAGALTLGVANTTIGQLILQGSTSGSLTIAPQTAAGTPVWTAGTGSGTPAVTASLPLAIATATGNVTCATCATSTLNTAALTKTDDTNVTLTLGGSPSTALLNAASITVGWTSQLAVGRGGTGQSTLTANAFLTGNTTSAINQVAITGLVKGNGASAPGAYAGTSCTNQFIRSLDLNAAATCASVANTDLTNSSLTYGSTTVSLGSSSTSIAGLTGLGLTSGSTINWNSDSYLGRAGAANLMLGQANAASPVAQTLSVQNATGTNTAAAASLIIVGPLSTGTGTDGDIIFQTGVKTISGSTGATPTTALTIKGETQNVNLSANLQLANAGSIIPASNSTTALYIANAANSSKIVTFDTSNLRVGINKTPGAYDLDVNATLNVGTILTFGTLSATSLGASTSTITGLTVNNSPNSSNDYFLYYSAADGAIRKCTIGSCISASTAGVQSLNGLTGGLSIVQGSGIAVSAGGTSITVSLSPARLTLPTVCAGFSGGTCPTSGTNATYTTPANVLWIEFVLAGAGGPGAGGNNTSAGTTGGDTCLKASGTACSSPLITATGGAGSIGGASNASGAPGTASGCNVSNQTGNPGTLATSVIATISNGDGGTGGATPLGGAGLGSSTGVGSNAAANSGSGGGGGAASTTGTIAGAGGPSGGYCRHIINSPAASYVYTIGAGQTGAAGGTGGSAGGNSAAGFMGSIEHYGS